MSSASASTASQEALFAVLVAIANDTLLVPNVAVAEVISRESLQAVGGPVWFSGMVNWQGKRAPVIRFELLNGSSVGAAPPRRERILLIHAATGRLTAGLFGLMVEGYPHLITLNRAAIRNAPPQPKDVAELVAARARIANQEVLIPNLETLENTIGKAIAEFKL